MSQYEIAKKELIFKQVHCTGFFSEIPEMYCLKYNTYDNRWYFYKKNQRQLYVGCATENPASWKHNPRYELMYKDFSGFVAKIDLIQVSMTLGIALQNIFRNDSYGYEPDCFEFKGAGCSILAATVYLDNGCDCLVPLDCIREFGNFSNGQQTKDLMKKMAWLTSDEVQKNSISISNEGKIEIKNTYYSLSPDKNELLQRDRYLILDVRAHSVTFKSERGNEWFYISDDEYNKIIGAMKSQNNDHAFLHGLSFGETNFVRLVNFVKWH